ncbi:hypothetical protein [Amycolatopsis sp. NPDC051372]|uniref:hypothetical protein n=1 Tax=Amycolatopsis sp. NPDC051372 TaxID=3155669 RepID=UPI003433003F
MSWEVAFVLVAMAVPIVFVGAVAVSENRHNRRVQRSPESVRAICTRLEREEAGVGRVHRNEDRNEHRKQAQEEQQ